MIELLKSSFINQNVLYFAEDLNRQFNALLGMSSGACGDIDFKTEQLTTPTMQLKVNKGGLFFWGMYIHSDADEILNVVSNTSGNDRVDALVIDVNGITGETQLKLLTGTPSANPTVPELTPQQYMIAQVSVKNSATSITNTDIKITKGSIFLTDEEIEQMLD